MARKPRSAATKAKAAASGRHLNLAGGAGGVATYLKVAAHIDARPAAKEQVVAKSVTQPASGGDLAARLKGLTKAQVVQVAKDSGNFVNSRTSAKVARDLIVSSIKRSSLQGLRHAMVTELDGPPVPQDVIDKTRHEFVARQQQRINAAIEKVTAAPRASVSQAAEAEAMARNMRGQRVPIGSPARTAAEGDMMLRKMRADRAAKKAATPKAPTVAALRADAKAAGVKGVSRMTKPQLLDLKKAGKFSIAALAAAPAVAAAIAYDSTKSSALASGQDGATASLAAAKAAAVAGGTSAAVVGAVVAGAKAAAKLAPVAGKVLSRALPAAAIAGAVYEAGAGAIAGYRKDGTLGAVKGAAEGAADFATFGGYSYLKTRGEARSEAEIANDQAMKDWGKSPASPSPLNGGLRSFASQAAAYREAASKADTTGPKHKPASPTTESDGWTDPHQRRGPAGKMIQVGGYKTVLPK